MKLPFARVRLASAVVLAFVCGLVFASSLDLTRFGYAQGARPAARDVKQMADASNAFVSIAEHVTPAVVSIQTARDPRAQARPRSRTAPPGMEDFFRQFDPRAQQEPVEASGSGFITSKDGYILTNNHVVADADRVNVTLTDHRVFRAKVIGRDPDTDIAVIKIDGSDLPTVALGDDAGTRIGEWVLAIGNPLGLDFTVTAGIISAKGRGGGDLRGLMGDRKYAISDFIQTDAAINPGNSGGPLVNGRGEVIGINSAIASPTGFYSGYGFAIPVTLARNVMDQIIKYGRVRRAILGVAITEVLPEDAQAAGLSTIAGVKVDSFSGDEDSPAQKSGIQIGDIITVADGKPVDRVSTLQRIVRSHEPGETIEVGVVRLGGEKKTLKIKLAEPPSENATVAVDDAARPSTAVTTDKLGIAVEALTPTVAQHLGLPPAQAGLRVADVSGASSAHNRLFPNGDVISEILFPGPRRPVRSVADFEKALSGLKSGDVISVLVLSGQPSGTPVSRVVSLRVGS
jgi:serine protease Do